MMKPPRRSSQGTAARVIDTTERALRSITACTCASPASNDGIPSSIRPALLIRPSRRPSRAVVSGTMRSHSAGLATSPLTTSASPPARSIPLTSACASASLEWQPTATFAPCPAKPPAIAAPMPVEPPVTSSVLPARSGMTRRAPGALKASVDDMKRTAWRLLRFPSNSQRRRTRRPPGVLQIWIVSEAPLYWWERRGEEP